MVAQLANTLCSDMEIDLICTEPIVLENNPYAIDLSQINVYYLPIEKDYHSLAVQCLNRKLLHGKYGLIQSCLEKVYYTKRTLQRWKSFIDTKDYNLIIGCSMTFNILLGKLKPYIQSQVLGWEHNEYDSYFGEGSYEYYQREIYGHFLKSLDGLIVLTHSDARKYEKAFALKTIVMPNPLSFNPRHTSLCMNKEIIAVGRLDTNKQFDVLINVFEMFLKEHSDWQLKIVGEGTEKNNLVQLINDKRLSNQVKLLDYTNNIEPYYKEASIYACTSKFESFGLTVLEAMSCGLPVVTFNSAGPSDLVTNGVNGYVVSKGNETKFTEYMCDLANNPNKRIHMGKASIEKSSHYQLNTVMTSWKRLLANIMKQDKER
ncbi:glycosyltransferase [Cellulosilyticum ruminicola]|uniref:glycosyltransferase n=1 Tax=Cellulosilyticum ruminicola TaxID=425254 RepID=UPI0006D13E77|nr:glycosyltransferase [Cellulosilyticum ruminicola]